RGFGRATTRYQTLVGKILRKATVSMVAFAIILGAVAFLYHRMPSAFLPAEDQGYFITNIQLPVGATQERTYDVLKQVEAYYAKQPEIESFITVAGFSFNGRGQNSALSFARLKDWKERPGKEHSVQAVIARASAGFASIKDAIIFPVNPPAIPEMGNSSGFDFQLQDLGGLGHAKLMEARTQLLAMAAKNPNVAGVRSQGLEDAAQLKIDVDQDKASALGVSPGAINATLQTSFGSSYVNNFVNGNRIQRVIVQLDAPYRMSPDDVKSVYVRNAAGEMVPLAAFTKVAWTYGAPQLQKYNGFPSIEIVGGAAPGKSTGEAMDAMESMANQLPKGISYEWTGQSFEERLAGAQAPMLYLLSLLVVFLCLAALYESWTIPFSVILVVPLGILGALLAATLRGLPNDVYFKVGLLTTVGLATKNAILIIEYAKDLQSAGRDVVEAVLEAVHLRLRPILMTSLAFILGVMPLVLTRGAGSASQNAIGTGVAGGMFAATALGIFMVPVFYVVVMRLFKRKPKPQSPQPSAEGLTGEREQAV
ncbi:MAG: efflux RND transporter permease subunit, partial [Verrucomicrobiota bacterium]